MRKYRNKRTGSVIELNGDFSGKDWEAVTSPDLPFETEPEEAEKPKKTRKKSNG